MIVSVCADKGAPGVTTLATALGLVWPGEKVLLEADPSGADLPFRLRRAGDSAGWLLPDPSIGSLAAVARLGALPGGPARYAQPSALGVAVIPGALSAERYAPLKALWPPVAQVLAGWPGTVIADLGRCQPGHPALPVAKSSAVVLLLARADLAGFFHLRERVTALAQAVGDPTREVNPVAVVLTGPAKQKARALAEAAALLTSIGSPTPVAGFIPHDPRGAQDLWTGPLTRRLAGSELIRAVRRLAEQLLATHPDLAAAAAPADAAAPTAAGFAAEAETGSATTAPAVSEPADRAREGAVR